MIHFLPIIDDEPALAHSPMVHAIEKTFAYIADNGPIGLTPSKAFKRVFVHWAAAAFDWPGYSNEKLFSMNKVLNEIDFPPLMDLHDLLIALKIGRHYKGNFRLTKAGQALVGHPGRLFGIVTPFFLFEFDHTRFTRIPLTPPGNWDVYLNVLNVEAESGVSGHDLDRIIFGNDPDDIYGRNLSGLYVQVLRPLIWTGLLTEHHEMGAGHKEAIFIKTPLWHSALQLETDPMVIPIVKH